MPRTKVKTAEQTLVELAYVKALDAGYGRVKAYKVAADVLRLPVGLAIAYRRGAGEDGRWPTQGQYASYWAITDRTAQREWERYREIFGEDADPQYLARQLDDAYGLRLEQSRAAESMALVAPASLLGG
jgi:hypothetical protein